MTRRQRNADGFRLARDGLRDERGDPRRRPKTFASTAPKYFVPSFAVRRPVVHTDETEEFMRAAGRMMPRGFDVSRLGGITIIEQRRMIKQFREAELYPEPEKVERVARAIAEQMREALKGTPRRLEVPAGRIFRFGSNNGRLGIVPAGWRGYDAHYARRGQQGEKLPMPIIVRETIVSLGSIAANFTDDEEDQTGMRITGLSRTPHFSFARKYGGGISPAEERAITGPLEDILPETIPVFDPVIHLTLTPDQEAPITIFPRSPGAFRTNGLVEF